MSVTPESFQQQAIADAGEQVVDNRLGLAREQDTARTWVDPRGYRLSDRLWDQRQVTRDRIDRRLREGMARGEDAIKVAKDLEQFLHPGIAPKRNGQGKIIPGTGSIGSNTRGGVGSYPAMRLARTEVTRANGQATINAVRGNPYTMGVQWLLSSRHKDQDQCTVNANQDLGFGKGIYPADFVPRYPEHPNCLCTLAPYSERPISDVVDRIVQDLRPGFMPDDGTKLATVSAQRGAFGRVLEGEDAKPFWKTQLSDSEASSYTKGTRYHGQRFRTVVSRSDLPLINEQGLGMSDGFLGYGVYGTTDQPYVSTFDMATIEYVVKAENTLVLDGVVDLFQNMADFGIRTLNEQFDVLRGLGYDSIEHKPTGTVMALDPSIVAIVNADPIDPIDRADELAHLVSWHFNREGEDTDWHEAEFARFDAKLTDPEREALTAYQQDGNHRLNAPLRAAFDPFDIDPPNGEAQINLLDGAIKKQITTTPVVVHRGVNENFIQNLGLNGEAAINSVIRDPAFVSTTIDHEVALRYAEEQGPAGALMELMIPEGATAAVLPDGEVLLPRNTRIRIIDYAPTGPEGVPVYQAIVEPQDLTEFGPKMATQLVADAIENGGTTISYVTGGSITPTDGYAVGGAVKTLQIPHASTQLDADGQLPPDVRDQIDLFIRAAPTAFVGSWIDTETDILHIDATDIVFDRQEALDLADRRHEIAIFDFSTFEEIRSPNYVENVQEAVDRDASDSDVKLAFVLEPPMKLPIPPKVIAEKQAKKLADLTSTMNDVEYRKAFPDEDRGAVTADDFTALVKGTIVAPPGQKVLPGFTKSIATDIKPTIRDFITAAANPGFVANEWETKFRRDKFNTKTTRDMVIQITDPTHKGELPHADGMPQIDISLLEKVYDPGVSIYKSTGPIVGGFLGNDPDFVPPNPSLVPILDSITIPKGSTAEFIETDDGPRVALPDNTQLRLIATELDRMATSGDTTYHRMWVVEPSDGSKLKSPFAPTSVPIPPEFTAAKKIVDRIEVKNTASDPVELEKWFEKTKQKHNDHLTADEAQALDVYIGQWYNEINAFNRGKPFGVPSQTYSQLPDESINELTRHLDGLIGRSFLDRDVVLYRGASEAIFNHPADKKKGTKKSGSLGSVLMDYGFTSASHKKRVAELFGNVQYKIIAPKGTNALVTANSPEGEVIFPRGQQFRVIDYDPSGVVGQNPVYTLLAIPSDSTTSDANPGLHLDLPEATKTYQKETIKNAPAMTDATAPPPFSDDVLNDVPLKVSAEWNAIMQTEPYKRLSSQGFHQVVQNLEADIKENGVYSLSKASRTMLDAIDTVVERLAVPADRDFYMDVVRLGPPVEKHRFGPADADTVVPLGQMLTGQSMSRYRFGAFYDMNYHKVLVKAGTPVLPYIDGEGITSYILPRSGYVRVFDTVNEKQTIRQYGRTVPEQAKSKILSAPLSKQQALLDAYMADPSEPTTVETRPTIYYEYISPDQAEDLKEPAPLAFLMDQEDDDALLAFTMDDALDAPDATEDLTSHFTTETDATPAKQASAFKNVWSDWMNINSWARDVASDNPVIRDAALKKPKKIEQAIRALDAIMVESPIETVISVGKSSSMAMDPPNVALGEWSGKGFVYGSTQRLDDIKLATPPSNGVRSPAFEIVIPAGTRYAINPAPTNENNIMLGRGYTYRLISSENRTYEDGTTGKVSRWAVVGDQPAVAGAPGVAVDVVQTKATIAPPPPARPGLPEGFDTAGARAAIERGAADFADDRNRRLDALDDHNADLTVDEFQAIDWYIGPGYYGMNLRLRQGTDRGPLPEGEQESIAALDGLIGRKSLDGDMFVIRAASEDMLMVGGAGRLGRDAIGTVVSNPGYTSVTTDVDTAAKFIETNNPAYFRIMLPDGSPAFVTTNEEQEEIILPRDSQFAVVGYQDNWTPGSSARPAPRYDLVLLPNEAALDRAKPGIMVPSSSPSGTSVSDPDVYDAEFDRARTSALYDSIKSMHDRIGDERAAKIEAARATIDDVARRLRANGKFQTSNTAESTITSPEIDQAFADAITPTTPDHMVYYMPFNEQMFKKDIKEGGGEIFPMSSYITLHESSVRAQFSGENLGGKPIKVIVPKGTAFLNADAPGEPSGRLLLPREGALYSHSWDKYRGEMVAEYIAPDDLDLAPLNAAPPLAFSMDEALAFALDSTRPVLESHYDDNAPISAPQRKKVLNDALIEWRLINNWAREITDPNQNVYEQALYTPPKIEGIVRALDAAMVESPTDVVLTVGGTYNMGTEAPDADAGRWEPKGFIAASTKSLAEQKPRTVPTVNPNRRVTAYEIVVPKGTRYTMADVPIGDVDLFLGRGYTYRLVSSEERDYGDGTTGPVERWEIDGEQPPYIGGPGVPAEKGATSLPVSGKALPAELTKGDVLSKFLADAERFYDDEENRLDHVDAHNNDLNADEFQAIDWYIGSGYISLNDRLRQAPTALDQSQKDMIDALDDAVARHRVSGDMFVLRGSTENAIYKQLGVRGHNAVGLVMTDPAYVSTTTSPDVAASFVPTEKPAYFRILLPDGSRALVTANDRESEVILPRDSEFMIVDYEDDWVPEGQPYDAAPRYDMVLMPSKTAIERVDGFGIDVPYESPAGLSIADVPQADDGDLAQLNDLYVNNYDDAKLQSIDREVELGFAHANAMLQENGKYQPGAFMSITIREGIETGTAPVTPKDMVFYMPNPETTFAKKPVHGVAGQMFPIAYYPELNVDPGFAITPSTNYAGLEPMKVIVPKGTPYLIRTEKPSGHETVILQNEGAIWMHDADEEGTIVGEFITPDAFRAMEKTDALAFTMDTIAGDVDSAVQQFDNWVQKSPDQQDQIALDLRYGALALMTEEHKDARNDLLRMMGLHDNYNDAQGWVHGEKPTDALRPDFALQAYKVWETHRSHLEFVGDVNYSGMYSDPMSLVTAIGGVSRQMDFSEWEKLVGNEGVVNNPLPLNLTINNKDDSFSNMGEDSAVFKVMVPYGAPILTGPSDVDMPGDAVLPPDTRYKVLEVRDADPNEFDGRITVILGVVGNESMDMPSVLDPPQQIGPEAKRYRDQFIKALTEKNTFAPTEFEDVGKPHNDADVTGKEYDAVNAYIGPLYTSTNRMLRDGDDMVGRQKSVMEGLDTLIGRNATPRDVILYRGADRSFVERSGVVGYDAIGSIVDDKGFLSTSRDIHTSAEFGGGEAALYRILVPEGYPAYISANVDEGEVILPRGSRFEVVGYDPSFAVDEYTIKRVYDLVMLPNDEAIGRGDPGDVFDPALLGPLPAATRKWDWTINTEAITTPVTKVDSFQVGGGDLEILNETLARNGEYAVTETSYEKKALAYLDNYFKPENKPYILPTPIVTPIKASNRDIRLLDRQNLQRGDLVHWAGFPVTTRNEFTEGDYSIRVTIPAGTPVAQHPDGSGQLVLNRRGRLQIVRAIPNESPEGPVYEAIYIAPERVEAAKRGEDAAIHQQSWVKDLRGQFEQASKNNPISQVWANALVEQHLSLNPDVVPIMRAMSDELRMRAAQSTVANMGVYGLKDAEIFRKAMQLAADLADSGHSPIIMDALMPPTGEWQFGEALIGSIVGRRHWTLGSNDVTTPGYEPSVSILIPGDAPRVAIAGRDGKFALPPGSFSIVDYTASHPDKGGRPHYTAVYTPDEVVLPKKRDLPLPAMPNREESIKRMAEAVGKKPTDAIASTPPEVVVDYINALHDANHSIMQNGSIDNVYLTAKLDETRRAIRDAKTVGADTVMFTSFEPSQVFPGATGTDMTSLIGRTGFPIGYTLGRLGEEGQDDALRKYQHVDTGPYKLDFQTIPVKVLLKPAQKAFLADRNYGTDVILGPGTAFSVIGVEQFDHPDPYDKTKTIKVDRLLVEAVAVDDTGQMITPLAFTAPDVAPEPQNAALVPAAAVETSGATSTIRQAVAAHSGALGQDSRAWANARQASYLAPIADQRALAAEPDGLDARIRAGAIRPDEVNLIHQKDRAIATPAERDVVLYRSTAGATIPIGSVGSIVTDAAYGRLRVDPPDVRSNEKLARVLVHEGTPLELAPDGQQALVPRETSFRVIAETDGIVDMEALPPVDRSAPEVTDPQVDDFAALGVTAIGIENAPVKARQAVYNALAQAIESGVGVAPSVSWESFAEDRDGKMVALYDPKTGTMRLNSNATGFWNDPDPTVRKMHNRGWTAARTAQDLIVHELAHAAQDRLYKRHGKKLTDLARDTFKGQQAFKERVEREVSKYAASNKAEFMAEVFVGLTQGRTYSDEIMTAYEVLDGVDPRAADPLVNARHMIATGADGLAKHVPDPDDPDPFRTMTSKAPPTSEDWSKLGVVEDLDHTWIVDPDYVPVIPGGATPEEVLKAVQGGEKTVPMNDLTKAKTFNAMADAYRKGAPMPIRVVTTSALHPELKSVAAYYTPDQDTVTIPINLKGAGVSNAIIGKSHRSGFLAPRSYDETITHELGHAAHHHKLLAKGERLGPEWRQQHRALWDDIQATVNDEISRYAAFQPAEFVAEVFTLLMTGRRDQVSDRLLSAYRAMGGWDPEIDGLDQELAFALEQTRMKLATKTNPATIEDFESIGIEANLTLAPGTDDEQPANEFTRNTIWNAIRKASEKTVAGGWLPPVINALSADKWRGTVAVYDPDEGSIGAVIGDKFGASGDVGSMASNKQMAAMNRDGWTAGKNAVDAIVHELGHAAHAHRIMQDIGVEFKRFGNTKAYSDAMDGQGDQGERFQRAAAKVSKYATTEPKEFVAEVYLMLVNGRADELDDEVLSVYEEWLGPEVEGMNETGFGGSTNPLYVEATEQNPISDRDFLSIGLPVNWDVGMGVTANQETKNTIWNAIRETTLRTNLSNWYPVSIDMTDSYSLDDGTLAEFDFDLNRIWASLEIDPPHEGYLEARRVNYATGKLADWFVAENEKEIIIHELGHAAHHARMKQLGFPGGLDDFKVTMNYVAMIPGGRRFEEFQKVAEKVSKYAAANPIEFVAEVYTGLVRGDTYGDDIMGIYAFLEGPKISPKPVAEQASTETTDDTLLAFMFDEKPEVRRDRVLNTTYTPTSPPGVQDFKNIGVAIEPGVTLLPPRTLVQVMSAFQHVLKNGGAIPSSIATAPHKSDQRLITYYYNNDRMEIVTNPDGTMRMTEARTKKSHDNGWLAARDIRELVLHELGHRNHWQTLREMGWPDRDPRGADTLYTSELFTEEVKSSAKEISSYAATDPYELVAEVFVLDQTGRGSEVPERVRAFLREFHAEHLGVEWSQPEQRYRPAGEDVIERLLRERSALLARKDRGLSYTTAHERRLRQVENRLSALGWTYQEDQA